MHQISAMNYFFPRDLHHMDGFFSEIARCIPEHGRILDLGCGVNDILERFRTPDLEVWGTDFQRHTHLKHEAWFRQMGETGKIPFDDGTFDVVICISVMEHVAKPEEFLREVYRVLRPGGRFIGHSISGRHYVTWIRRSLDVLPHSATQKLVKFLYGREEEDTFPTCYRMNKKAAISRSAADTGFDCERFAWYADPGYFSFAPPLIPVAVMTDWALTKISTELGRLYFTATLHKPNDPGHHAQ